MSSNLLKQYRINNVTTEKTRVIDSNDLVQKRIEEISRSMQENISDCGLEEFESDFSGGIAADRVAALLDDDRIEEEAGADDTADEGVKSNVIKANTETKAEAEAKAAAEAKAWQEIEARLEEAKNQAQQILEDAKSQAQNVLEEARKKGKEEGYAEGMKQADAKAAQMREQLAASEKHLEQEYESKVKALEPEFIHVITGVYEHIFGIELTEYKDVLRYLIEGTIKKADSDKNFIVHVSPNDYENILAVKQELKEQAVHGDATLEVVEDVTVPSGECMIETENGVFDCGIGTQLTELKKRLRLLSFSKEDKQ